MEERRKSGRVHQDTGVDICTNTDTHTHRQRERQTDTRCIHTYIHTYTHTYIPELHSVDGGIALARLETVRL